MLLSIQDFNVNCYVYGKPFLKLPKHEYPKGDQPQCMFLSRDAYERILRRMVLSSSDRIQWVTGTAIGVRVASIDPSKLEAVTVRLPDNTEEEISAALVIGMCFRNTVYGFSN